MTEAEVRLEGFAENLKGHRLYCVGSAKLLPGLVKSRLAILDTEVAHRGRKVLVMDAGADKAAKDNRGWGAIDHARNRVDARRDEVVKFLEPIVPASTAAAPPQVPGASK